MIDVEFVGSIVQAEWHPLSDHVAILTDENVFQYDDRLFVYGSLYSVEDDVMIYNLKLDHEEDIIRFGFGCNKEYGWHMFTVYLLDLMGNIYYLTPIIPYGMYGD